MSQKPNISYVNSPAWSIRPERKEDASSIDSLTRAVFGPGMFTRAAYFLREGIQHEMQLSFVAEMEGKVVGSVRLTKIYWGQKTALMLGPLGVLAEHKHQGIGKKLMERAVEEAKVALKNGSPPVIMLVGDLAYYQSFGFKRIPAGQISLPRSADPMRILVCELTNGAAESYNGAATRLLNETH